MRLTLRTTLTMLLVASIPLALLGWSAIHLSNRALTERTHALHASVAQSLAEKVGDTVASRVEEVQHAAAAMNFASLRGDARLGALRLVFRQIDGAAAVVLLDPSGAQAGGPVYLDRPASDPVLAGRPALKGADIDAFASHLPLESARKVGTSLGPVHLGTAGDPRVAVASKTRGGYFLAVELSLAALSSDVADYKVGEAGRAFVVGPAGHTVLGQPKAVAASADRSKWPPVAAAIAGTAIPARFDEPGLGESLGAVASVPRLGWSVVVAEPATEALAGVRALTRRTLLWLILAIGAALVLGIFSTRAVLRPVQALHQGALALEKGDLSHRIGDVKRRDELGDLARTFDTMAGEIERWNHELEDRVDQKTKELREAQELLLRSQKMAAVGELGAGVAHEINNPLSGVLGMTQILLKTKPDPERMKQRLEHIETQALRIRDIVENLRRLTVDNADVGLGRTKVDGAIEGALTLVAQQLADDGIQVVRAYGADVPEVPGNEAQLTEAFLHLIKNARAAMKDGGTLTVGTRLGGPGLVAAYVTDTGVGIAKELQERIFEPFFTDQRAARSQGMGLALVSHIVESHHGRITVHSSPGKGATFTLLLPAAQMRSLA